MANETALDLYKVQFADTLAEISQQIESRLQSLCIYKGGIPENFAYERVGTVEPRKLEGRNQAVQFDSIDHNRRWLEKEFYVLNLPVDEKDVENMVTDPKSEYARAIAYGFNRQKDRIILAAVSATIKTGKYLTSSTLTAAADGVLTINATAGITLPLLLQGNRNFVDNEVGNTGSNKGKTRKVFVCSGDEEMQMLQIATLTSGDYDRRFQLQDGELQYAIGYEIIKYGAAVQNPVLSVSGGVRTNFILAEGFAMLGVGHDFNLKFQPRYDLENVMQIKGDMSAGALRLEGNRCQLFTTTDL